MFRFADVWSAAGRIAFVAMFVAAVPLAQAEESTMRIVPNALLSIDQNRTTVIDRIVTEWGEALANSNAGISVDELRTTLQSMRSDYLLAASVAGSLDGLRNVIASSLTGATPAASKPSKKMLGDTADDLVYTPVTPCRIVDTRNVGGAFSGGGETRSYHGFFTSGNFAGQGGASSNCGIPANPAGLALNIVALGGAGYLIAWPFNTPQPNASTLNPAPGQTIANMALVPLCQPNCAFEFNDFTFGAQVIIDVVGYFAAPVATAVQCTQVASAATPIPAGSDTAVLLPSCPTGYTRTGSQCSGTSGVPHGYLLETHTAGCVFRNLSSVASYNATAVATCCRIPGR
jgi:hypothetical protein